MVDWYEEEHEKRHHANGHGGRQRFGPQRQVEHWRLRLDVIVAVIVVAVTVIVMMVAVTRTQLRQSEKDEREQQQPADVLEALLRRHDVVGRWNDRDFFSFCSHSGGTDSAKR